MRHFVLALVLLAGCGSKAVRFEREPGSMPRKAAILFVPGFYGSALADVQTGERVFASVWSAAFSNTPLANTVPDLGVPEARKLRSDGVLEYLRVVPPLFSFDIYGGSLGFLRDKFGDKADIVPFDYDWRQELSQSAKELGLLVNKLRADGATKIAIVSHSLGGLVTAYYLRETENDATPIVAAVIGGTPFSGAAHAFRNLQHGTSLGWSKTPLAAVSLGTFPSMYDLVPVVGSDGYRNGAGKPLGKEVVTPEFWRTNHLGLFKKRGTLSTEVQTRREAFVAQELTRAVKFHERLRAPAKPSHRPPAMLYLVADGTPTFSHARWNAGAWSYEAEDETVFNADGDNTVTVGSATPPPELLAALPGKVFRAKAAHESIYNEKQFRAVVERFLTESFLHNSDDGR